MVDGSGFESFMVSWMSEEEEEEEEEEVFLMM
jgi:hypothetical protein